MSWFPFSKAAISVGVAEKKAMRKLFSVCSKTSKLSAFRQILYKHENRKKRTWKKRVATVNSQQKKDHVQLLDMFGNTCILKTGNPRKDMRFIKKKTS